MPELTGGVHRPLARARVYSLVQDALGARRVRRHVIGHHLRPRAGERVLDLGCGPGDIVSMMPSVVYTGVDISEAYIAAARQRFGDRRATFIHADVRGFEPPAAGFEAVIAIGLLHHLDDAEAARLVRIAASALTPTGRLVTVDPARSADQHRLARWLIERDRGRNVREPGAIEGLASPAFAEVAVSTRHDLARVPYTHAILEARQPRRGGE